MQPARAAVSIVVVTLLAVAAAACGSPGPTPSHNYSNRALGVSVRYPASWSVIPVAAQSGERTVAFGTDKGFVNVTLNVFPRGGAGFENATGADLTGDLHAAKTPIGRVLHTGFQWIAGVRYAEVEYIQASVHIVLLSTSVRGTRASFLIARAVCPTSLWSAQRATETTILDSLRISRHSGSTVTPAGISGMAEASGGGLVDIRSDPYAFLVVKSNAGQRTGVVVATVKADAGGLFRLSLPPGRYLIYGRDLPSRAVSVTVWAGRYSQAAVVTDLLLD